MTLNILILVIILFAAALFATFAFNAIRNKDFTFFFLFTCVTILDFSIALKICDQLGRGTDEFYQKELREKIVCKGVKLDKGELVPNCKWRR